MAVQRTKEIGIRKVLGATIANIVVMFTKESAILIIIGFFFAAPLAYFISIAFLMELPERVDPGVDVFILTLISSLIVALVTVGLRMIKTARMNPVESLRSE